MKPSTLASWSLQATVVVVLAPAIYLKASGQPDAVASFTALGMEPTGRYLIALLETLALILLLIPQSAAWGALLAWGLMSGALIAHLTRLGISESMTTPTLAALAVWVLCAVILLLRRNQIEFIRAMFACRKPPS